MATGLATNQAPRAEMHSCNQVDCDICHIIFSAQWPRNVKRNTGNPQNAHAGHEYAVLPRWSGSRHEAACWELRPRRHGLLSEMSGVEEVSCCAEEEHQRLNDRCAIVRCRV